MRNCILFSVLTLVACTSKKEVVVKREGLELAYIDSTVRVQDDLFRFANGGWLKKIVIPPDRGSVESFSELYDSTQLVLLTILKNASADNNHYPEGSDQRKVSDFYSVGMDSLLAEKRGIGPLSSYFKMIEDIASRNQLQSYLVEDALTGGNVFLQLSIESDAKDSNKPMLWLYPSGLGLPERDYYLKTDARSKEIRERYKLYTAELFTLAGAPKELAARYAEVVLKIEAQLAKSMLSKEDRLDPHKLYHPLSVSEVSKLMPSLGWSSYLSSLSVKEDTLIVTEPFYLKEFEKILVQNRIEDVRTYLKATLLRKSAPLLTNAFVMTSFNFNGKYLNGVERIRPRWKRVLANADELIGDAIGKLYVEAKFPPEARKKALEMVGNIKLAFADRIKGLEWMSDTTKMKALEKLSRFSVKIGYPDKWKNYSGLALEKDTTRLSYFQNVMNGRKFSKQTELLKLGKPADKSEWMMTPQTINAYYSPAYNEIVFPAAILQPPFYDYRADEAINYGGIGAVIGHEISHGFDDSGSQYDGDGNMKNWWKEVDMKQFKAKSQALINQYNHYEPLPGVFVQGEFTLGENIGDLGGLAVAYDGLQRFLREQVDKPALIDGYTPEQRFFISWATIWRSKSREQALRTQVNTDPHSPEMYRANGPVGNMIEFYDAFGIKPGDKMYRAENERIKIW